MVESGVYTCGEIHALTQENLGSISKKISDMRRLERTLIVISALAIFFATLFGSLLAL